MKRLIAYIIITIFLVLFVLMMISKIGIWGVLIALISSILVYWATDKILDNL